MRRMRNAALAALLLIVAAPAFAASELDTLVERVIKTYGGEKAWTDVRAIAETGRITSTMAGNGSLVRTWGRDSRLRVEIHYASRDEVRILQGDRGSHNGEPVTGMQLDAMTLQWARLAFPAVLIAHRAQIHDGGIRDGLRVIEVSLSASLKVMAAIDPKTAHIVRSASEGKMGAATMQFVTEYHDFRMADGLLFAFAEDNYAQGMKTAETTLEKIDVK
jgi:hypothetical protein